MKQAVRYVLALALALVAPRAGFGQQVPAIIEAESGTVGSEFTIGADGTINYIGINATVGGDNPHQRQPHRQLQRHVPGRRHLGAVCPAEGRPHRRSRPQRRQPLLRQRLRPAEPRGGRRLDHRQQPVEHRLHHADRPGRRRRHRHHGRLQVDQAVCAQRSRARRRRVRRRCGRPHPDLPDRRPRERAIHRQVARSVSRVSSTPSTTSTTGLPGNTVRRRRPSTPPGRRSRPASRSSSAASQPVAER